MTNRDAQQKRKLVVRVLSLFGSIQVLGLMVLCLAIVAFFDVRLAASLTANSDKTTKGNVSTAQVKHSRVSKVGATTAKSSSTSTASTPTVAAPVVVPSPKSSVYKLTLVNSKSSSSSPNYNSGNWAGYMATKGNFTGITASWGVPEALGSYQTASGDGTWIGIGGITNSDLIQIGTQNSVSASGQVTSTGFYEILPAGPQLITSVNILPGTPVTASIDETQPGLWKATLTNESNEQTFTIYLLYNSSGSSGEWIEEDPSTSPGQFEALDNFGDVSFTSGSATINGANVDISASGAQPITMVNQSRAIVAKPSAIQSGTNFDVNWQ